MSEELKPCPFCGTKAMKRTRLSDVSDIGHQTLIQCGNPFCFIKASTDWHASQIEAAKEWNTRTPSEDRGETET